MNKADLLKAIETYISNAGLTEDDSIGSLIESLSEDTES